MILDPVLSDWYRVWIRPEFNFVLPMPRGTKRVGIRGIVPTSMWISLKVVFFLSLVADADLFPLPSGYHRDLSGARPPLLNHG